MACLKRISLGFLRESIGNGPKTGFLGVPGPKTGGFGSENRVRNRVPILGFTTSNFTPISGVVLGPKMGCKFGVLRTRILPPDFGPKTGVPRADYTRPSLHAGASTLRSHPTYRLCSAIKGTNTSIWLVRCQLLVNMYRVQDHLLAVSWNRCSTYSENCP